MSKIGRSHILRLSILFCISVLIRIIPMRKWVYGMDEAMHLIAPSFMLGSKDLDTKPGYSFILTIIFVILDNQNPFFIRLLTVIFTSFMPLVGYSIGRKLGGEKIGWVTAILLTFNHRIFDLSYWIMTDIPFTFLTFLSIYLIFRNFESFENSEGNLRLSFTAGIICGLSYLFRQLGAYLILLVILFYFLTKKIDLIRKFENFTRFFFGVAIMLVPWFLWSYIQFGVLDPAVSVINTSSSSSSSSSSSIFYVDILIYSWLLVGLLTSVIVFLIIYYKNKLIEIKKTFRVFLVCTTSVFYIAALLYFVYFSTRGIFKLLLYYIVQIPGLLLGFHLINQYEVNFYAIIISSVIIPIVLVGLVIGYQMNKLLTRITILSIILLLVLLVNIIYFKVRYFYPIIPVLTPFFLVGLFKIKDFTIYGF